MKFWPFLFAIHFFYSCGQQDFPNYGPDPIQREERSEFYRTDLKAVNPRISGQIKGYAVIRGDGLRFYVRVNFQGQEPHVIHHQYIHSGSRCPTRKSDLNRDGVISFSEVMKSSGQPLLPLDWSLKTRIRGFEKFPESNRRGQYIYVRSTSYDFMLQEMRSSLNSPNIYFRHLEPKEEINFEQRTIIIYGSLKNQMLPVACAEWKVDPNPEPF